MTEPLPLRLRPAITALAGYRQGRLGDPGSFKLSSNENPFDPLPGVLEAVAAASGFNRYPEAGSSALRSAIAARFEVALESVHVGAGSVSIIDQLLALTCDAGDEVVFSWRSFEAYPLMTTIRSATAVPVPNAPDGGHDLDAMAAAITDRTRLVLVCTPNNPTGPTVTADDFLAFMAKVPSDVVVALDEAYAEFVTLADAVDGLEVLGTGRFPNLVVLRTFSKAWGLAGLRIGYAFAAPALVDLLRTVALPLSVTEAAQLAAIESLAREDELLERVVAITTRRTRLRDGLLELGFDVPVAQGNFVWLPVGERAAEIAAHFEAGGVIVRPFPGDGVRISIGEDESVGKLLSLAAEIVPDRTNPATGAV